MTMPESQDKTANGMDFAMLFASSAHEIKNQLFRLLQALEQVRQEPWARDMPSARNALENLGQGGAQIGQRLTQLLILYRIGQGHYPPDIAYRDAAELLEEVEVELHPLLGNAELTVSCAEGVYGFFDRELVRGIMLNAVHNALAAGAGKIVLSAGMEDAYLFFRVEDDGPGFPGQILESGAAPARSDSGGTGLGLHFCATAAALHRNQGKSGFIRLNNGGSMNGAVFSVYLP